MNDIETKLAAPIDKHDVKRRKSGGGEVDYITARTVMNRLDSVVGPSGWYDVYHPIEGGVECTLFIRFGEAWVGKTDVGTVSRVEPVKGMYSDALKRAACKWGIARELYQEGTALDDEDTPPSAPASKQPPRRMPFENVPQEDPAARNPEREMPIVAIEHAAIVDRARRTYPFEKDEATKGMLWTEYIKVRASWQKILWPAVKALGLSNDTVHTELHITSVKEFGGTVAAFWFEVVKMAPPEQQELRPTG